MTARSVDAWSRLTALAIIAALAIAVATQNHRRETTTAPVEVRLANLPAGEHRVVISAERGYRRVVTMDAPDGSIGDGSVPIGALRIEVEGICAMETTLDRGGEIARVDGLDCSV